MSDIKHDLDHEVYLDPKDHKEHINHGMLEYSEADLKDVHANYEGYHKDEIESGDHHDPNVLEVFCDIHPDEPECLVYDD